MASHILVTSTGQVMWGYHGPYTHLYPGLNKSFLGSCRSIVFFLLEIKDKLYTAKCENNILLSNILPFLFTFPPFLILLPFLSLFPPLFFLYFLCPFSLSVFLSSFFLSLFPSYRRWWVNIDIQISYT